jgi:hypothetical protein
MNIVILNGGLGNNLFQLAYGYSSFRKSGLALDWCERDSFFTRKENSLLRCDLPGDVTLLAHRNASFLFKLCNLHLLHMLTTFNKKEKFIRIFFDWFMSKICLYYLIYRYRGSVEIYLDGKKFTKNTKAKKFSVHVGYYQTENYVKDIDLEIFQSMFDKFAVDPTYAGLVDESNTNAPVIVHIRIGDYIDNPDIGQLHATYFASALDFLSSQIEIVRIWVFSDSEELVDDYIPKKFKSTIKIIPTQENTPTEVLKMMSLGSAYILSNSTFSWWAAYLGRNQPAPVIAPTPWFAAQLWDENLIPKNWNQVHANFNKDLERYNQG